MSAERELTINIEAQSHGTVLLVFGKESIVLPGNLVAQIAVRLLSATETSRKNAQQNGQQIDAVPEPIEQLLRLALTIMEGNARGGASH